jgi:hypothetical protein
MSLSPEIIEARIRVHIAMMRVAAAQIGLRRAEPVECFPPVPARRPRPRDALPPLARRSGGDGR